MAEWSAGDPGPSSEAPAPSGTRAGQRAVRVLLRLLAVAGFVHALPAPPAVAAPAAPAGLALPAPRTLGPTALEAALAQRRSLRSFAATPLTVAEAGQLLWAAQGQTGAEGRRTAPSAGATYPLVLYLVAGRVDGVAAGVYRYRPQGHSLVPVATGDVLSRVAAAARGQSWLARAPALLVVAAEPSRTAARYGARADRYVAIETGAAAQNLLLQATALGLGGTLVGAFDEAALRAAWPWVPQEQSLLVVALGRAP